MDGKQAGQIAAAGLAFGLISFVAIIALSVYVLYYQKDDKKTTLYKTASPASHSYGSANSHSYGSPGSHSYVPLPHASVNAPMMHKLPSVPKPPMNTGLPPTTYAAPPIPPTIASGTVGTFFDDELPQA